MDLEDFASQGIVVSLAGIDLIIETLQDVEVDLGMVEIDQAGR